MTQGTKTVDEQDKTGETPLKPFPDWPYIPVLLELFEREPTIFMPKSRTMMATWTVCGWAAFKMFTRPATRVIFQSQDEKRALDCVKYVKWLWENSLDPLKRRWPLTGETTLAEHAKNELKMANLSTCMGIVGRPDKVRSEHPTIYVADEAAFMVQFAEAFAAARGARPMSMICLSSANPGDFADIVDSAAAVTWSEYWRSSAVAQRA